MHKIKMFNKSIEIRRWKASFKYLRAHNTLICLLCVQNHYDNSLIPGCKIINAMHYLLINMTTAVLCVVAASKNLT